MNPETFPLARGVPMELLTERGLNRAFIKVVEEHRRDGRPVVTRRDGQTALVSAEALTEEVIVEYCFNLSYGALRQPEFEKALHDPIVAANAFSNVSLQFPWLPKILFNLPQWLTVKMLPEYAQFFRMQGVCEMMLIHDQGDAAVDQRLV